MLHNTVCSCCGDIFVHFISLTVAFVRDSTSLAHVYVSLFFLLIIVSLRCTSTYTYTCSYPIVSISLCHTLQQQQIYASPRLLLGLSTRLPASPILIVYIETLSSPEITLVSPYCIPVLLRFACLGRASTSTCSEACVVVVRFIR